MTDNYEKLLEQHDNETAMEYHARLFSHDPTGVMAAWDKHVEEHHRIYLCHCHKSFAICDEDATHCALPNDHGWDLIKHPMGHYEPILKCPSDK